MILCIIVVSGMGGLATGLVVSPSRVSFIEVLFAQNKTHQFKMYMLMHLTSVALLQL